MKDKGVLYTAAIVVLVIPLILFLAFYATVDKTKSGDTITKIRCDELHYFVEDIRSDMERALVIFGRRAAIYAIDDVVSNGKSLNGYAFNCSSACNTDCESFEFPVNGSQAAVAELMVCGTLDGDDIQYMVNHTLSQWLARIEERGSDMNFNVSIDLNNVEVVMKDPWTFTTYVNTSFNVFDESGTCFYVGDMVRVNSDTSIIGLEDPLFPLNTNAYVIKYVTNCSVPLKTEYVAGCSTWTDDAGDGQATGDVIYHSTLKATYASLDEYCNSQPPEIINNQILVLDQAHGACNTYDENVCFNASSSQHFAGVLNYGANALESFAGKCNITIPWLTATGDVDDDWPRSPALPRPPECAEGDITEGGCVNILNNEDCGQHQVILGTPSNQINTTCYRLSTPGLWGQAAGPSFFDRLDGRYNLSATYANQSMHYFGTDEIGLETLVDPYYLDEHGVNVKSNASWVDYLYWQGVYGCQARGACAFGDYYLRLDKDHAESYAVDTVCANVTGCPGSTEVCVNYADEDLDEDPDWLDYDCRTHFAGCGYVRACDISDTDECSLCDNPLPPVLGEDSSTSCEHYGYNTSEWHFYQVTPSSDGLLKVTFSGTSNVSGSDKTDLSIYNYSLDAGCGTPHHVFDMESSVTEPYCVLSGETYVVALDVDSPGQGHNGSYVLSMDLEPLNPLCPIISPTSSSTSSSTSSPASTPPIVCGFFDDMEDSDNGWTASGQMNEWERGIPDWGSAYSGSHCWGTDLSPWYADDYEPSSNQSLKSPSIDLSTASAAQLTYRARYWLVNGPGDVWHIEASADEVDWDTLATYTWRDFGWSEHTQSLNAYAGGPVWLRLRLESDDNGFTREGLYVDYVNVSCT